MTVSDVVSSGCMLCVRLRWKRKTKNSFARLVRHKNKQKHKLGRSPVKKGRSRSAGGMGLHHIGKKTIRKITQISRRRQITTNCEKTRQKHHRTKYLTDQLSKYTYTGRDDTPDVMRCGLTCLHVFFLLRWIMAVISTHNKTRPNAIRILFLYTQSRY